MAERQLIGPIARSTPPGVLSRDRLRPLPADLLRDASRRLAIMALVAGALWLLGAVLGHLAVRSMSQGDPQWLRLGVPDLIAALSVAASLVMFLWVRARERDPRGILDLGLAYMVFNALALALMFHWQGATEGHVIAPEISWVGAVVLMFAAILPSTPLKTAVSALIAVSMNPISMLIARARGVWPFDSPSDALIMHYPDFLLVGVAVVISHIMTSLGQQVARAREMGSYELGELLGRGGMGEVYRATHRMLARPAAIKLIRPEMIGPDDPSGTQLAILRFRREAEAAANLRSPHTVELYDFGVTEDQTLYFVMELLEGIDLESLVQQHGPQPASRVVHILRQACASLEEAHVRGLVHRDIKPANIHIGRLGLVDDFVKVLDFGLVKPVAERSDAAPLTTQAGLIVGTPAYMAPEMITGDAVDGRADLYALGCVAYYLLTGLQVFDALSTMQVISKHLEAAPVPPSARVPFAIPAGLEALVLACLAKNPDDRPASAAELARHLTLLDLDPWTEAQARQWWTTTEPSVAPPGGDIVTAPHIAPSPDAETVAEPRPL